MLAAGCFREASHPELPQVIDEGGPVLTGPRWAVITFADDPLRGDIETFTSALATSDYWKTAVGEYGVGPATAIPVELTDASPTMVDDQDIHTFIAAHLDPLADGWPPPQAQPVYAVFYTESTMVQGACTSFGAYHSDFSLSDGTSIAYAVIPRCAYGGSVGLDDVTEVTSHELAESATDPLFYENPAYQTVKDYAWRLWQGGGEIGDMCQGLIWDRDPTLGYTVQRIWSNAAAGAGHDPCAPDPSGDVYFLAAPELPDTIYVANTFGPAGAIIETPGVHVPIGSEQTIDVRVFSDQSTGPIAVSANEWPADALVQQPDLALSWDRTTGTNGDTLHLTIGARGDEAGTGHEYLYITAQLGDATHYWPVAVSFQ